MIEEIPFCTLADECPYLKDRECKMEYKYLQTCSKSLNQELIFRGWRRFGKYFLRPICEACQECLSLRICARDFKLSKQYRRVLNKNTHTKMVINRPHLSDTHLFLFDKYHQFMHEKREWKASDLNFRRYFNLYVDGAFDFGYELDFYVNEKLVCVDLIDVLEDGISSIYCFYDPDFCQLSLGKFSLLSEIMIARNLNLKYIYLGYYVKNCQSLKYKADYTPNEILKEASALNENAFLWEK